MKILILNNNSIDSNRSISIDLICQNLANVHSNLELEIDLICNSLLVHEHVFLKTTQFREIKTSLAIDKLWKRKENSYDLIVGVGITGFNKLYYWAISGKKKASIGKTELKKYRKLGALDFETQIAEIILKKVIKKEQLFDLKPNVYLDEVKLKSTKKVINWLLQSNDQKLLDRNTSIFVYLSFSEYNLTSEVVLRLIDRVIRNRGANKVILIVKNEGDNLIESEKYLNLFKGIDNHILNLDFMTYDDYYYALTFSKESTLTITNDTHLNKINLIKDQYSILMQKKTLNDVSIDYIIERMDYYLSVITRQQTLIPREQKQ